MQIALLVFSPHRPLGVLCKCKCCPRLWSTTVSNSKELDPLIFLDALMNSITLVQNWYSLRKKRISSPVRRCSLLVYHLVN